MEEFGGIRIKYDCSKKCLTEWYLIDRKNERYNFAYVYAILQEKQNNFTPSNVYETINYYKI